MPYAKLTRLKVTIITLIFCLKTYKWRLMEILWRSASYFHQKLWCERGLESPCANQPFFVTFLVQPVVTPEKLQSCMGREFSVPVKHLALTFTFGQGNWGTRSVVNAQRPQSSLGWSLEICRHANDRPQTDKRVIYFHFSSLRLHFWELHINGAIGVSRSSCCSWALLPLLLDL